jgi:hypothetical protein
VKVVTVLLALSPSLFGQNQPSLTPVWEVRKNVLAVVEQIRKLPPLLERADARRWVERGAPDAYVKLLDSSKNRVGQMVASAEQVAKDPEKLSTSLDLLFRIETSQAVLGSLRDGVRKYQGEDLANQLTQAMTDTANSRETLKQHVFDLAQVQEQQMQVMNEEAQRCRGQISRSTPPTEAAKPLTRGRRKTINGVPR